MYTCMDVHDKVLMPDRLLVVRCLAFSGASQGRDNMAEWSSVVTDLCP